MPIGTSFTFNTSAPAIDNRVNFDHSIPMNFLVILHGAPAVGKLTIARNLSRALGGVLYDNHSSLELIKRKIPYGSPGFDDAVWSTRMAFFSNALSNQQDVIFTLAYELRKHAPRISELEQLAKNNNVNTLPVYLYCGISERLERVSNLDRKNIGKIHIKEELLKFEEKNSFQDIKGCQVSINTEVSSPIKSRDRILKEIEKIRNEF